MSRRPPHPQLLGFLEEYDPAVVDLVLGLREIVLQEAPGAEEAIYQSYTLALWYGSSEKMKDWFCYIATYAKHVNLGFVRGAELADPNELLEGQGKTMRHIQFKTQRDLERPYVRRFIRASMELAGATGNGSGKSVIKPTQRLTGAKKATARRLR